MVEISSLILTGIGVLFGAIALWIAIAHLRRTENAAQAAEKAATETGRRMSILIAVASIEQLCSRSRDLMHLTRARNLKASATAAFELREGLAKFSTSASAASLNPGDGCRKLLQTAGEIHDTLERAAVINKMDQRVREECLRSIAEVHANLNKLAGSATKKVGD